MTRPLDKVRASHAVSHRLGRNGVESWCEEDGEPQPCDVQVVLGSLDALTARHAALVEAADAVCQAWIADEAGEETFDPNLIDALGDALYGKPEDRAALIEEARK